MSKVYDIVTEKMIAALEAGTVPWRMPWKSKSHTHVNQDGRPYRGINPFLLEISAMTREFEIPLWLTFKNVSKLGGKVREGEKASMVVFWTKYIPDETPDPETGKVRQAFVLRYYNVFNIAQTEGVKLSAKGQAIVDAALMPQRDSLDVRPIEAAQAILDAYTLGPEVKHLAGEQAAYSPTKDIITIARQADFDSDEAYYSTMFHEQTHATGHKSRLNREGVQGTSHFGNEIYSKEELVAEMGAAFLSTTAGIEQTFDNSAAYIKSWITRLKSDTKLVVQAAAQAQKAADFILGTKFETEEA